MIHAVQLRAGLTTGVIGRRGPPGRLPPPVGRDPPARGPAAGLAPVVGLAPAAGLPPVVAFPSPGLPAAFADLPVTRTVPGSDLLLPPCGVLMLMGPRWSVVCGWRWLE